MDRDQAENFSLGRLSQLSRSYDIKVVSLVKDERKAVFSQQGKASSFSVENMILGD
jgi:hypothetical protein